MSEKKGSSYFLNYIITIILLALSGIIIFLVGQNYELNQTNSSLQEEVTVLKTISGENESLQNNPKTCLTEYKNDKFGFKMDIPCNFSRVDEDLTQAEKGIALDASFYEDDEKKKDNKMGVIITTADTENNKIENITLDLENKGINSIKNIKYAEIDGVTYQTETEDKSINTIVILPVGIFKYEFYFTTKDENNLYKFEEVMQSLIFLG